MNYGCHSYSNHNSYRSWLGFLFVCVFLFCCYCFGVIFFDGGGGFSFPVHKCPVLTFLLHKSEETFGLYFIFTSHHLTAMETLDVD